jgi:hypothetical protein
MGAIVDEVAALTEALEVPHPIVLRIVVQMGCRKNDPRLTQMDSFHEVRPTSRPTMVVTPRLGVAIEPAPVRKASYDLTVRPTASFANTIRPLETHTPADVGPVARIEPT